MLSNKTANVNMLLTAKSLTPTFISYSDSLKSKTKSLLLSFSSLSHHDLQP